jgi:hypothetical protein
MHMHYYSACKGSNNKLVGLLQTVFIVQENAAIRIVLSPDHCLFVLSLVAFSTTREDFER